MRQILEGVKVADFSWMIAGSRTAKYLADHGAQVIHIESMTHIDPLRTTGPFKDKKPGVNRSAIFAGYNNDKYGITLNLSHPKGPEIARKLVQWADIVIPQASARIFELLHVDTVFVISIDQDQVVTTNAKHVRRLAQGIMSTP